MSNSSVSRGIEPVGTLSGGEVRYGGFVAVDSSNSGAIYKNSPIKLDADGNASLAAATESIKGVVGDIQDSNHEPISYLPTGTAGYINYADAKDLLVRVMEDSDGGALTTAAIGSNFDIVAGSGSTTSGLAGTMLDSSDSSGASSAQLHVLDIDRTVGNAVGNYCRWICSILEYQTGAA